MKTKIISDRTKELQLLKRIFSENGFTASSEAMQRMIDAWESR